jgi:signal transduction histidine kinase
VTGAVLAAVPIEATYAAAFALAAVACLVTAVRARRVNDRETRWGLVALLASAGGWSASHSAVLVAETRGVAVASYLVGLILGFFTVWAWLYFCSAYTGRVLHRDRGVLAAGAGVYLGVVAVKLTNPFHHLYFRATVRDSGFPTVLIQQGAFHWAVTGLSYALAAVGMFMLFELFREADYGTRGLGALVAVTGIPVLLDVYSFSSPALVDVIHSPLGVAVFAVGVLYVHQDRFLAVQLTGDIDDPVVLLDDHDRIRAVNDRASERFPALDGAVGERVGDAAPTIAAHIAGDDDVLSVRRDGDTEYYLVADSSFALGGSTLGRALVLTEITETERQRREVERHNAQLEGFAAGINHELRNAVQVATGYADHAGRALEAGDVTAARDALGHVSDAVDRMADRVTDLSTVARHGRTVRGTESVAVRDCVEAAWANADTADLSLSISGDATVDADPIRVTELFESTFEFAADNDATKVDVDLADDAFVVTDDGDPPAVDDPERFFDYGDAVPTSKTGMRLPTVRTLARVHGWSATIDTDYRDGVRISIDLAPAEVAVTTPAE